MDEDRFENVAMIACVTFETAKVIEPLRFFGTRRIHIIHYVKDDRPDYVIYREFYDEVCRRIGEIGGIEIVEHNVKVYDYQSMLSTVIHILNNEEASLVRVNISSGTSEYSAAAVMAASMYPKAMAFTVGTREYTTKSEDLRALYSVGDRLVGLSKTVYGPKPVETFSILSPDIELVRCLKIIETVNVGRLPSSAPQMIKRLKDAGIWSYVDEPGKRTPIGQRETMYYNRHYVKVLADKGWIRKDSTRGRYSITVEGRSVLNVFTSVLNDMK